MAFITPSKAMRRLCYTILLSVALSTLATAAAPTSQDCIGMLEGSGNYNSPASPLGHQGKYQMGVAALRDAGFCEMSGGPSQTANQTQLWQNCVWTAKAKSYGVNSVESYVNSPAAQDAAYAAYNQKTHQYASHYDPKGAPCCVNLYDYVGKTMDDGTVITEDTINYIVHHGGAGGAYRYLSSNGKDCVGDAAVNSSLCQSAKKMNECMNGSTNNPSVPGPGPGAPTGLSGLCT